MKNKLFKIFTILLIIIGLIFNYLIPTEVFASAPSDTSTYGIISVYNNTGMEDKDNASSITATYANGVVNFTGTGLYSEYKNNQYQIYATGNVTVDCLPNANYTCELWENGTNSHGSTITLNGLGQGVIKNIDATFNEATLSNTVQATINVSAGEGSYQINKPTPPTGELTLQSVPYDDQIQLRINGSVWNPESSTIDYDSNPSETTVVFTFETLWINRYYDDITINNHSYNISDYIDFDDRYSWLTHNNGSQMVSFSIPNVPKSDIYNIVAKHGENNGTKYLATFLWTSDPAQAGGHDYIGNSKLEFVKATYEVGDQTFVVTEDDIEGNETIEDNHKVFRSVDGFLNYGVMNDVDYDDGGLTLPGEAEVTMRVVPEYGYQVTSVNGGSDFTTTDDGVSEFTVTVHNGEAGYFQAEVTEVDDKVLPNSEKVKSGSIKIGTDEIDAGTVELSVDDVELDSSKIKDFENAAGDYNIKSYLDINLNQVLYKGTEDDVWSTQIHHLNNEATISLKLEKGVDVNDIVIVHNIDDGDQFEIIPIESYNPKTRVITFKTKSFSNFAIAGKETVNNTVTSIKTGDNVIMYVSLLTLCILIVLGKVLYTKKKRTS